MSAAETARCIYCLETKSILLFDRDHVIPQAFGTFAPDLVLDCVCKECNGEMGRTIEQKMARDAIESLDRVKHGVNAPADYKTMGRKSTLRSTFAKDGPLHGAIARHVPSPDGADLGVSPAPQVLFGKSLNGPFTQPYPIDQLPTTDELIALGFERGTELHIKAWGPREDVNSALAAKGLNPATFDSPIVAPSGPQFVETVGTIGTMEFRVATKIALNFLAWAHAPHVALVPQFNEARAFARYGATPAQRLVEVGNDVPRVLRPDGTPGRCHLVVLRMLGDRVVANLSLFGRFHYMVTLASEFGERISFTACAFDLDGKCVVRVLPPTE